MVTSMSAKQSKMFKCVNVAINHGSLGLRAGVCSVINELAPPLHMPNREGTEREADSESAHKGLTQHNTVHHKHGSCPESSSWPFPPLTRPAEPTPDRRAVSSSGCRFSRTSSAVGFNRPYQQLLGRFGREVCDRLLTPVSL